MRPMRIAILGTRGVPAAYGGFETFAEELGARLVQRGHAVTVYGRSHSVPAGLREHRGMRLRIVPTIRHKYLDTVVHTAISALDSILRNYDIALVCNSANAPFALIPRIGGAKVALNVDGLEWQRRKWSRLGQWYYQACAWLAPKLPIVLVSDAEMIARYYRERFGRKTVYIPYGTDARRLDPGATLERLGLAAGQYILYVSRLEPENHALTVIEGYRAAGAQASLGGPLVLVGDAPYAADYRAQLVRAAASVDEVMMPGYVFGDGYAELQSNALLYVQATEVGGTHPALLEAMGRGAAILANDVPEHREVLGEAGLYYARNDPAALAARLQELAGDAALRARLGAAAAERAARLFSWDRVTDEYESLFRRMTDAG
jgi:glycosyltransferase involved in cell wall biosynthesis